MARPPRSRGHNEGYRGHQHRGGGPPHGFYSNRGGGAHFSESRGGGLQNRGRGNARGHFGYRGGPRGSTTLPPVPLISPISETFAPFPSTQQIAPDRRVRFTSPPPLTSPIAATTTTDQKDNVAAAAAARFIAGAIALQPKPPQAESKPIIVVDDVRGKRPIETIDVDRL